MDKAQMVNVDAAAIMHNGQWLKISDRDEVKQLQNQSSNLSSQVSNLTYENNSLKSSGWFSTTNNDLSYDSVISCKLLRYNSCIAVGNLNNTSGSYTYLYCPIPNYRFASAQECYDQGVGGSLNSPLFVLSVNKGNLYSLNVGGDIQVTPSTNGYFITEIPVRKI